MSNSRRVKIQLVAGSPSMDEYTRQLMTTALGDFIAAQDPKPDDFLVFDFSFKDMNGDVHQLNPYRLTRASGIRAIKELAKQ